MKDTYTHTRKDLEEIVEIARAYNYGKQRAKNEPDYEPEDECDCTFCNAYAEGARSILELANPTQHSK